MGINEKPFIIVDIERPAALHATSALPGGAATTQSETALMPPPAAKPIPAAVPVPDPDLVKKMFQRMGEDGSQHSALLAQQISGHGSKNNKNPKDQTESRSSNLTENSRSETVLPKIKPIPAEADLIPPKTYKAVVANKKLKEKVGTIGGITSGQDPIECGSFYNNSDNRVARSVYKEDLISMSVTSMSFNPKTLFCTACPKSHSVLEEGGRGGWMVGWSSLLRIKISLLFSLRRRAVAWRSCGWSRPRWMT